MRFLIILFGVLVLDFAWWRWAHRQLRSLKHATLWRSLLGAYVGVQLAGYVWIIASRTLPLRLQMPLPVLIEVYLWHILVLPCSVGLLLVGSVPFVAARVLSPSPGNPGEGRGGGSASDELTPADASTPTLTLPRSTGGGNLAPLSRRQLLISAAIAIPPLAAAGTVGVSMGQLHAFRVRKLDVDVPGLPPALDGLTVAHVTDMHIGRFTFGRKVDDVARTVNALKPDLVLITGDIIDYRVADLPVAFEMLKRLDRPDRVFMCEGNHDLFQGRADFEGTIDDFTKSYGIPLLVNENRLVRINGTNVQILGLRYGDIERRNYPQEEQISDNMKELVPQVRKDAFPILMAHHPHAFDPAAEAGLPITFCGHTHGGQLMLTKNIGAGPLMFKYWSGLYRKPNSRLVVANGVGNWFPLRINAPAEIILATLRLGGDA